MKSLLVASTLTFKKGARHVVEQELETHSEPVSIALHEMSAELVFMLCQYIQAPVKSITVDLERIHSQDILERTALVPMLGDSKLGLLGAKTRGGEHRSNLLQ